MKHCTTCQFVFGDNVLVCPHDNTQVRFVRELEPGMIIRGKYQILQWVGAGGMAAVYRAKHRLLNELRAIKVVLPKYSDDQDFLKRFRNEAAVARKLRHENAVWVEDLDEIEDGRPFIAMEFLDGTDLRSVIQKEGPLPVARTLALAEQIASALGAAHKLGITHRDVKPDNVFITRNSEGKEVAKVLDFGIAKVREGAFDMAGYTATKTGILLGTPQYISPEQALGKVGDKLDGRADLYSLGIVIYEMLTGRLPFESDTPMGMLLQHVNAIPRPPHELCPNLGIPRAVSLVLMKALEKDRDKRFQTADEMVKALRKPDEWATGAYGAVSSTPPPPPPGYEPTRVVVSRDLLDQLRVGTPPMNVERRPQPGPGQGQGAASAPQMQRSGFGDVAQRTEPLQTVPERIPQDRGQATLRRPEKKSGFGPVAIVISIVVVIAVGSGAWWFFNKNPDADIRDRVQGLLSSQDCCNKLAVNVSDGVVKLTGDVLKPEDKSHAGYLANVSGVKHVDLEGITVTETPMPTPRPTAVPVVRPTIEEAVVVPTPHRRPTPLPRVVVTTNSGAGDFIAQGNKALADGNYEVAITKFKLALEVDPGNAQALAGLRKVKQAQDAENQVLRNRP